MERLLFSFVHIFYCFFFALVICKGILIFYFSQSKGSCVWERLKLLICNSDLRMVAL